MPDMSGIEATRAIRASGGRNRLVPIVAATANAFSQDRRDCLDAGMNGFLAKPMTKQGLMEAILAVLTRERRAAGGPKRRRVSEAIRYPVDNWIAGE